MKISVDTKEDSHDDIRKVIRMLQHLVGDNQEVFTNEPSIAQEASPMANIFGDSSSSSEAPAADSEAAQETQQQTEETEEASESTEDLFAELFSEEELKKMDTSKVEDEEKDEEEEIKPKKKKHDIEFY